MVVAGWILKLLSLLLSSSSSSLEDLLLLDGEKSEAKEDVDCT